MEQEVEFDFIEEEEDSKKENSCVEQKHMINIIESDKKVSNVNERKESVTVEDEDIFEFVEEEEQQQHNNNNLNKQEENINNDENNINKHEDDDMFEFVEEGEENAEKTILNENKDNHIELTNNVNTKNKNQEKINDLIKEFSDKYKTDINKNKYCKKESKDININNYVENFKIIREKQDLQLSQFISNLSIFEEKLEVQIKPISIADLEKASNNFLNKTKENNKIKNLTLQKALIEIPNNKILNLYFTLIEIKNIYRNIFPTPENVSLKKQEDILPENIETATEKESSVNKKFSHNYPKSKFEQHKSVRLEEEDDDFDFNEIDETEEKSKSKIEINKALFDIVIDPNAFSYNSNIIKGDIQTDEKVNNESEPTPTVINENDMMDLLKTIGVKTNKENVLLEIPKESLIETEYEKIIVEAPNYKFLLSKYVEYPDSLLNF